MGTSYSKWFGFYDDCGVCICNGSTGDCEDILPNNIDICTSGYTSFITGTSSTFDGGDVGNWTSGGYGDIVFWGASDDEAANGHDWSFKIETTSANGNSYFKLPFSSFGWTMPSTESETKYRLEFDYKWVKTHSDGGEKSRIAFFEN